MQQAVTQHAKLLSLWLTSILAYFLLSTPGWALTANEVARLVASDPNSGDQMGYSVAVDRTTAIIGAPSPWGAADPTGSVYICVYDGVSWQEEGVLNADEDVSVALFGHAVAVSGDTVVVGAPHKGSLAGSRAGAVYVFERNAGIWIQTAKLTAGDSEAGDEFGVSVAISGDTVLVGASFENAGGYSAAGSAYVFERNSGVWTEQAKLNAGDKAPADYFGASVSLSGNTALIGAYGSDPLGTNGAGAAYVFERTGASWIEQATLVANDAAAADSFGWDVALDGNTAVIGANQADISSMINAGAAYVFERTATSWTQQAKLVANDLAATESFGTRVAIAGDVIAVGTPYESDPVQTSTFSNPFAPPPGPTTTNAGAIYLFERTNNAWMQQQKLTASDRTGYDYFASDVALSDLFMIAGAKEKDALSLSNVGTAYVIEVIPPDNDGDGVVNNLDNCPATHNPTQTDTDIDGIGDPCDSDDDNDGADDASDNCPVTANSNQQDTDGDGLGDVCDGDLDGDSVPNPSDNCPNIANAGQEDNDFDGAGDICDNDDDNDGVDDSADNCALAHNPDQADRDSDGLGDTCDTQYVTDTDDDGVDDDTDNCPEISNSDQGDFDDDGRGDVCDDDTDNDRVVNARDRCASTPAGAVVGRRGCSVQQVCGCSTSSNSWRARFKRRYHVYCVKAVSKYFKRKGLLTRKERRSLIRQARRSQCSAR